MSECVSKKESDAMMAEAQSEISLNRLDTAQKTTTGCVDHQQGYANALRTRGRILDARKPHFAKVDCTHSLGAEHRFFKTSGRRTRTISWQRPLF